MAFCTSCGNQLGDSDRFCGKCGTENAPLADADGLGASEAGASTVVAGVETGSGSPEAPTVPTVIPSEITPSVDASTELVDLVATGDAPLLPQDEPPGYAAASPSHEPAWAPPQADQMAAQMPGPHSPWGSATGQGQSTWGSPQQPGPAPGVGTQGTVQPEYPMGWGDPNTASSGPPPARAKKRRWPWIVALLLVMLLVLGAIASLANKSRSYSGADLKAISKGLPSLSTVTTGLETVDSCPFVSNSLVTSALGEESFDAGAFDLVGGFDLKADDYFDGELSNLSAAICQAGPNFDKYFQVDVVVAKKKLVLDEVIAAYAAQQNTQPDSICDGKPMEVFDSDSAWCESQLIFLEVKENALTLVSIDFANADDPGGALSLSNKIADGVWKKLDAQAS